jgi:hypothetical protein
VEIWELNFPISDRRRVTRQFSHRYKHNQHQHQVGVLLAKFQFRNSNELEYEAVIWM